MNIQELIHQIKVRPEMYVGEKKLELLYHYTNGFLYSNIVADKAERVDVIFKKQFHEWVKNEIEREYEMRLEENRNYMFYIFQVCNDENERVDKFFELCEAFFAHIL